MFSMGMLSLLPVCPGRDTELPRDRLPLLISFSHGVLLTVHTNRQQVTNQDTFCITMTIFLNVCCHPLVVIITFDKIFDLKSRVLKRVSQLNFRNMVSINLCECSDLDVRCAVWSYRTTAETSYPLPPPPHPPQPDPPPQWALEHSARPQLETEHRFNTPHQKLPS